MSFSHEEKLIWQRSEVMQEFEKIATSRDISGPPPEAYLPIKEGAEWEEEPDENKLIKALRDLVSDTAKSQELPEDVELVPFNEEEFSKEHDEEEDEDVIRHYPKKSVPEDEQDLGWLEENLVGWGPQEEDIVGPTAEIPKGRTFVPSKEESDQTMFGFGPKRSEERQVTKAVYSNLANISQQLIKNNNKKGAYLIERALDDLKVIIKGDTQW